ncbi:MAG: 1,4-dihydroxy-2-naphthoate octaprenyltransferase [Acidimicrobiia bacterium]
MAVLTPTVPSRGRWLGAARPRTWPAAIVPVLVAGAAAYRAGAFDWLPFVLTLVGALSIQVAANFANDASDARRGADPADREGPPRMVASGLISGPAMWVACWTAIAIAALCGVLLAMRVGPVILLIGAVSVLALLTYVGGPIPYGYRGLGELFVLAFFGVLATGGSRLAYDGTCPAWVWLMGIPVGMLAAAILVANNLRDREIDARVNKNTLAVLVGEKRTRLLYGALMWGAMMFTAVAAAVGAAPELVVAGVGAAGLIPPLTRISGVAMTPNMYAPLLGGTARLHLVYGILLSVGIVLDRVLRGL